MAYANTDTLSVQQRRIRAADRARTSPTLACAGTEPLPAASELDAVPHERRRALPPVGQAIGLILVGAIAAGLGVKHTMAQALLAQETTIVSLQKQIQAQEEQIRQLSARPDPTRRD